MIPWVPFLCKPKPQALFLVARGLAQREDSSIPTSWQQCKVHGKVYSRISFRLSLVSLQMTGKGALCICFCDPANWLSLHCADGSGNCLGILESKPLGGYLWANFHGCWLVRVKPQVSLPLPKAFSFN